MTFGKSVVHKNHTSKTELTTTVSFVIEHKSLQNKKTGSTSTVFTTSSINEVIRKSQRMKTVQKDEQVSVVYLPLRRPLGNSPMVWESVLSKTTPFALIFGLWPEWWKKTWLITQILLLVIVTIKAYSEKCSAMQSKIQAKPHPHLHPVTYLSSRIKDDDRHDNCSRKLPKMHLTSCTTTSHSKTDITAVLVGLAVCKDWVSTVKSGHGEHIQTCS